MISASALPPTPRCTGCPPFAPEDVCKDPIPNGGREFWGDTLHRSAHLRGLDEPCWVRPAQHGTVTHARWFPRMRPRRESPPPLVPPAAFSGPGVLLGYMWTARTPLQRAQGHAIEHMKAASRLVLGAQSPGCARGRPHPAPPSMVPGHGQAKTAGAGVGKPGAQWSQRGGGLRSSPGGRRRRGSLGRTGKRKDRRVAPPHPAHTAPKLPTRSSPRPPAFSLLKSWGSVPWLGTGWSSSSLSLQTWHVAVANYHTPRAPNSPTPESSGGPTSGMGFLGAPAFPGFWRNPILSGLCFPQTCFYGDAPQPPRTQGSPGRVPQCHQYHRQRSQREEHRHPGPRLLRGPVGGHSVPRTTMSG